MTPFDIIGDCLREAGDDVEAGLLAAEYILSAQPVPAEPIPIEALFAHDIHNRAAQGVLNKSLRAARGLTAAARADLAVALERGATDSGATILDFIDKYRKQLTKLLTDAQMASVLEGAREVADKVPMLDEDAAELGDIPQPSFPALSINVALATDTSGLLIIVNEAAKQLAAKNVLSRAGYDALDAQARAKAIAVAGIDAEDALTKIRDALAETVGEDLDYETFRKKVLASVDEGTFLSDAHMETVFRVNVQGAFSDGQMTVLQNPLVRSGFPYASYDAIHDNRARHNHLALEKLGIAGTNVYRNDDPVFQMFRPPWDWNDRCSWSPMTVRQAAEAGVPEAKHWLETGAEPSEPAHVPMPPFAPPAGFQRAIMAAPLSIRLSMQPMGTFDSSLPTAPTVVTGHEDEYPRDKSNRFLDKLDIACAARDEGEAGELRESLPEDQRWKLDRIISTLQSGGAIHHPKEKPGLAILLDSTIADPRWAEYAEATAAREAWDERDARRIVCLHAVKKAVRAMRSKRADSDRVDVLLKEAGATDAEMRSISKVRHRVKVKEDDPDATEEMADLYEEVAEEIHQRLEKEHEQDIKPESPEEPKDNTQLHSPALGMVGDEWRGPTPPGEGWTPSTPGPRGGKRWRRISKGESNAGIGGKRREAARQTNENGRPVEGATARSSGTSDGGVWEDTSESTDREADVTAEPDTADTADAATDGITDATDRAPLTDEQRQALDGVNREIDGYADVFRRKGETEIADWMGELREHINELGVDDALSILGQERGGGDPTERVQYRGSGYFDDGDKKADFVRDYLDRAGIMLQTGDAPDPSLRTVASAPVSEGYEKQAKKGDVLPTWTTLQTKLDESKLLPGLESTEDLDVIVGSKVTRFTPQVTAALDKRYGDGKWIVKSYGDEAYAGFGIMFPQRAKQIQRDAKATIADVKKKLDGYGYALARSDGEVSGVTDPRTGRTYQFGSEEFGTIPNETVKRLGRVAHAAAPSERGAALPMSSEDSLEQNYGIKIRWNTPKFGGEREAVGIVDWNGRELTFNTPQYEKFKAKDTTGALSDKIDRATWGGEKGNVGFMAQPAFQAIGVSEADRALGRTWETSTEGRVHVVVKDGKASVVPFATLAGREDSMPVVFRSPDVIAMEQAAQDAIDALPESERTGQVYAPDVMKTSEGWRVVELNSSVETGSSAWLESNPFVIDAYVSHVMEREPSHVRFIRKTLKDRMTAPKTPPPVSPDEEMRAKFGFNDDHPRLPKGREGAGQFTKKGQSGGVATVQHGKLKVKFSNHKNKRIAGPHLKLKNYKQQDAHSCGFVAALTVARYFKPDTQSRDVLKATRPSIHYGVNRTNLRESMSKLGVNAEHREDLTVSKLRKYVQRGIPVIVSVWPDKWYSDHWVVVQGIDDDYVYLTNHKRLPIALFKKQWSDMDMRGRGNSREGIVCLPEGESERSFRKGAALSTDDLGNEHKGKGEGGGQFVSKGNSGGSGNKSKSDKPFEKSLPVTTARAPIKSDKSGIKEVSREQEDEIPDSAEYAKLSHFTGATIYQLPPDIVKIRDTFETKYKYDMDKQVACGTWPVIAGMRPMALVPSNNATNKNKGTIAKDLMKVIDDFGSNDIHVDEFEDKNYPGNNFLLVTNKKVAEQRGLTGYQDLLKYWSTPGPTNQDMERLTGKWLGFPDESTESFIKSQDDQSIADNDTDDGDSKDDVVTYIIGRPVPPVLAGVSSTPEEHFAAIDRAEAKLRDLPAPTEDEVRKAREEIAKIGTKKYRKNRRGNAPDRRKRRVLLLKEFGDGTVCPCVYCAVKVGEGTLEQDTIRSMSEGGRYKQPNLVPSCADCRRRRGKMTFEDAIKKAREHVAPNPASTVEPTTE